MYTYKEKYSLNFSNIQQYDEIHTTIKEELDFPDYYGRNWSACWDCLTEMVDEEELLHIELVGLEHLQQRFSHASEKIVEILKRLKVYDNKAYYDMIKIEIVIGKARYEIQ